MSYHTSFGIAFIESRGDDQELTKEIKLKKISPTPQLTKEDEVAAGDEVEVRREDQDKINRFSRLHQRELLLQEELKSKNVRFSLSFPFCLIFNV